MPKLTVKETKEAWKSPDGKITIWDVTAEDGTKHQTMSGKIGNASPGTEFEYTERTNDKGKTYIKPVAPEGGGFGGKGRPYHQYSQAEYEALFSHAHTFTAGFVSQEGSDEHTRLMSTYIIGAKDLGIKPEAGNPISIPDKSAKPTPEKSDKELVDILLAAGVQLKGSGLKKSDLLRMWSEANDDETQFVFVVKSTIAINKD